MNSRDRIRAAIRLEEPDRVPCSPQVSERTIKSMPPDDWESLLHSTDVTLSVGALGDSQIFGGQQWMDGSRTIREGSCLTRETETPRGILSARWTVAEGMTWCTEHFYKTREDIDKLMSVPYVPPKFDIANYLEWTEKIGVQGLVSLGAPSAFRFCLGFFGPQALYLMMADDPDLIEKVIATMNERLELYVEECCKKGAQSFWMGGSEHCGPGVVNAGLFKRMVTPYDKRIVRIIHEHDGIVNYHTHGKLKDILDDIAEIGVDVMSPIESGIRGDVTLAEVKQKIGDRICLKGNLDDMAFLALAPEDEVRKAAEDCIAQAAGDGGFILSGTDAGIYSPEWVQSFLAMSQIARNHPYR